MIWQFVLVVLSVIDLTVGISWTNVLFIYLDYQFLFIICFLLLHAYRE